MQVKLWEENESGLKKLIAETSGAAKLVSVSKMANWAIAEYIAGKKIKKSKLKNEHP